MRGSKSGEVSEVEKEFLLQTLAAGSVGDTLESIPVGDVLQRQTAIQLQAGSDALRPLYQQIAFPVADLQAQAGAPQAASADPALLRHLAARLDQRLLAALHGALGTGNVLDMLRNSRPTPVPLHVNLTLEGLQSDVFATFAALCAGSGVSFGVDVNVIEAVADPRGFAAVHERLAANGITLVIGGISHLTLQLARPWLLRPGLIKLDWSPQLTELDQEAAMRLDAVLAEIGPRAMVLYKAETEQALRWGLARGIRKFQGRHVDAMLGASRLVACPHANQCSLRQCIERAGASNPAGRFGCLNLGMLDAGVPPAAPFASTAGPALIVAACLLPAPACAA